MKKNLFYVFLLLLVSITILHANNYYEVPNVNSEKLSFNDPKWNLINNDNTDFNSVFPELAGANPNCFPCTVCGNWFELSSYEKIVNVGDTFYLKAATPKIYAPLFCWHVVKSVNPYLGYQYYSSIMNYFRTNGSDIISVNSKYSINSLFTYFSRVNFFSKLSQCENVSFKAVKPGTAYIYCTNVERPWDDSTAYFCVSICKVTVREPIKSAKISPKPLDLFVGQKGELNVTVNPKTASKDSLKWQLAPLNSSDIATIDSNGVVTAKKEGSVKIWLTDGKKLYDTCDVHVYPTCFFVKDKKGNYSKIDSELDKKEYTLYPGYVKGLNNILLEGRKFKWSSKNSDAISVDQNGKITCNVSGKEAEIKAESEGIIIKQKLKYKVNNFEIRHNYNGSVYAPGDIPLKSGTITLDEPVKLLYLVKKDTNEVIPLDDSVNLNFKVEIEKTSTKYAPVYYNYNVKGTLGLYAQEPNSQGKIRIYGKYKGEKFDVTEDVIVKKIHLYIMEKQLYNINKEVTLAGLLSTPMGVLGFFNIEIPIYKTINGKIHPLDDVQLVAVRARTVLEEMTDVIWETNNKNISIKQGKINFNCQEINEYVEVNVKNKSNTMTGKVTLHLVKEIPDIILLHGDGVKNNKEGDFKMNVGEKNVYVEAFPKNLKRNDNGNGVTISLDKTLGVDATFTSSNTNILSVNDKGLLITNNKVKVEKSVTITAKTKDGKTATVDVTVCPVKVKSVKITKSVRSKVGGTFTLTPTITPENATNKDVLWSSDNSSVAYVNRNGVVTCNKVGTAHITVTTVDGNKKSSCTVTVTKY